jgi:hypothetical protein
MEDSFQGDSMRESGEIRLERAFDWTLAAETRGREPASVQGWKTQ